MSGRGPSSTDDCTEATLRAFSNAAVEGIILHDRGRIVRCNDAAASMCGYSVEELVGRSIFDLTAPEYVDHVRANFESELAMTAEAWAVRRDGSRFRVQMLARSVPYGDRTIHSVVLRDLTEADVAARQHAATISLLRATLDSTADGILVVDAGGRITLYNERFLDLWRIPPEAMGEDNDKQLIGYVEHQLADPQSFRARVAALYNAPETESIDTLEFRDGRIVERYSRPQRIGDRIIGRVWSFRDVTSQRRAERTLELAVQMRDEFLGIASHELFTPITSLAVAVRGLRETAGQERGPAEKSLRDRLFGNAERQVERLARLVQELLDVTRIDGGRMGLAIDEIDLRDVAREVLERFASELERDTVSVAMTAPEPVVGCWDRTRLEQVVTNLVSNAIKFGKGHPIELSVTLSGGRAELSVTDHGIGIPPDQQALIFERFQRAVSSRHFAGLGLGLYITRQIVEAHGGVLRLSSSPGVGSTFTVRLPLRVPGER